MTIERVRLTGFVRVNPEFSSGARDVAIDIDYIPGDNDSLARALMARLREIQQAAMLADAGPVNIPLL